MHQFTVTFAGDEGVVGAGEVADVPGSESLRTSIIGVQPGAMQLWLTNIWFVFGL